MNTLRLCNFQVNVKNARSFCLQITLQIAKQMEKKIFYIQNIVCDLNEFAWLEFRNKKTMNM